MHRRSFIKVGSCFLKNSDVFVSIVIQKCMKLFTDMMFMLLFISCCSTGDQWKVDSGEEDQCLQYRSLCLLVIKCSAQM